MDFYTSITSNYIPKARVLAHSVKRAAPGSRFHLLLSDVPPAGFDLADEPFQAVAAAPRHRDDRRVGIVLMKEQRIDQVRRRQHAFADKPAAPVGLAQAAQAGGGVGGERGDGHALRVTPSPA